VEFVESIRNNTETYVDLFEDAAYELTPAASVTVDQDIFDILEVQMTACVHYYKKSTLLNCLLKQILHFVLKILLILQCLLTTSLFSLLLFLLHIFYCTIFSI
jgi:hypothetical protein